jgi:hypothetical protein
MKTNDHTYGAVGVRCGTTTCTHRQRVAKRWRRSRDALGGHRRCKQAQLGDMRQQAWSSNIGRVLRRWLIKHGSSHSDTDGHQRWQARRAAARHGTSITRQDLLPFLIILIFLFWFSKPMLGFYENNINNLLGKTCSSFLVELYFITFWKTFFNKKNIHEQLFL